MTFSAEERAVAAIPRRRRGPRSGEIGTRGARQSEPRPGNMNKSRNPQFSARVIDGWHEAQPAKSIRSRVGDRQSHLLR